MSEVWKAIPDFEGLYEVSSKGRVRSLDRLVTGSNGVTKLFRCKVLSPTPMNTGYLTISLSREGVARRHLIHRLVALAFLPNPDSRPEVNHKNGVKSDNSVNNLEWMGRGANIDHAVEVGLIRNKGERNPGAKLTEKEVVQIKHLSNLCLSPNEIAKAFGVTKSTISDIQGGRTWGHVHLNGEWVEIRKERGVISRVVTEIYERSPLAINCAVTVRE